jgi:hypothetical protein
MSRLARSRTLTSAWLLLWFIACAPATPPQSADRASARQPSTERPEEASAENGVVMSGEMEFCLFDMGALREGARKPTLVLRAPEYAHTEADTWTFKNVEAAIFSEGQEQTHIYAAQGELNRNEQFARLGGGATISSGTMRITLEEVEWVNEERLIRSDCPVEIFDGGNVLHAASLRYYPSKKELYLAEVTGRLTLTGKETQ